MIKKLKEKLSEITPRRAGIAATAVVGILTIGAWLLSSPNKGNQ